MRFVVTFGPTYEPLDQVRRLTNFSSGRLGTELTQFFAAAGHEVVALRGHYAIHPAPVGAAKLHEFTTTEDLLERLHELAQKKGGCDALFHAAAVSDFKFGQVFQERDGRLQPVVSGKFSTRGARLLAELIPTPKIIGELRTLFPAARLFGWKYEVEGDRATVVAAASKQIRENRTDFCVANGPAYGSGFGIISRTGFVEHVPDAPALCAALLPLAQQ